MEFEILTDKKGKEHMVLNSLDFEDDLDDPTPDSEPEPAPAPAT